MNGFIRTLWLLDNSRVAEEILSADQKYIGIGLQSGSCLKL